MLKIHKRYLKGLLKLGVTGMFAPQDFVHRLKSLMLHIKIHGTMYLYQLVKGFSHLNSKDIRCPQTVSHWLKMN